MKAILRGLLHVVQRKRSPCHVRQTVAVLVSVEHEFCVQHIS